MSAMVSPFHAPLPPPDQAYFLSPLRKQWLAQVNICSTLSPWVLAPKHSKNEWGKVRPSPPFIVAFLKCLGKLSNKKKRLLDKWLFASSRAKDEGIRLSLWGWLESHVLVNIGPRSLTHVFDYAGYSLFASTLSE